MQHSVLLQRNHIQLFLTFYQDYRKKTFKNTMSDTFSVDRGSHGAVRYTFPRSPQRAHLDVTDSRLELFYCYFIALLIKPPARFPAVSHYWLLAAPWRRCSCSVDVLTSQNPVSVPVLKPTRAPSTPLTPTGTPSGDGYQNANTKQDRYPGWLP